MARRPPDRKAQIARASAEAFSALGYHGVTMEDIASRVGVSATALYRHYSGKYELFRGAVLSLGRSIANVEELVDEVRVRLVEQRTPSLKVRIAEGDTLRFGAVTASREGIRVGDSVVGWDAVEDVEAEGGEIVVRGRDGKRLGAAPLGEVPNAFLLAELAHKRG